MQTASGLLADGTLTGHWVLDPRQSSVRLKTTALWGLVPVTGVFREVSAEGSIGPEGEASGTLRVAAASIDTRNPRRDKHLRSADFFDSARYQDMTFTLHGIEAAGPAVALNGALTIRGRTRPLSFAATLTALDGGGLRFEAETLVNRAAFGLTWNLLGAISVDNTLTVCAVLCRR
jgi:polyisoprenoid-binding protein YceI